MNFLPFLLFVVAAHSSIVPRRQNGRVDPGTASDCTAWDDVNSSSKDWCQYILSEWGLLQDDFLSWVGKFLLESPSLSFLHASPLTTGHSRPRCFFSEPRSLQGLHRLQARKLLLRRSKLRSPTADANRHSLEATTVATAKPSTLVPSPTRPATTGTSARAGHPRLRRAFPPTAPSTTKPSRATTVRASLTSSTSRWNNSTRGTPPWA
jgi:hypothetical protein